ncbi:hypothetical protein ACFQY7_10810 [Actinomadura luteofluorescens]|uniref:hypothetical protein n=1 Tax=Actinomadura luteofluorescens TaxID=46163 RepID=UPI003634A109
MRRPSRAALVKDVLLYGVLAFPVVVGMISPPQPARASWWLQAAGLGVLAAAIAAGRAWPAPALLTVIALTLVHGNFVFAMPVLSYLAGLRSTRARPLLWGFTGVFVGGALLSAVRGTQVTTWFPSTVWLVLLGVLPWLVGRYWRQYQELLSAAGNAPNASNSSSASPPNANGSASAPASPRTCTTPSATNWP